MLNEEKVKLMTRMAMYEEKQGQEDFKISAYYRKDYVGFHTVLTVIWITIGYAIAVGIGAVAFMEEIFAKFSIPFLVMLCIGIVTGYIVLVVMYGITASGFYNKRHSAARQRVKKFNYDLTKLNRMYERKQK